MPSEAFSTQLSPAGRFVRCSQEAEVGYLKLKAGWDDRNFSPVKLSKHSKITKWDFEDRVSQRSAHFCLLSAEIKGMGHYVQARLCFVI